MVKEEIAPTLRHRSFTSKGLELLFHGPKFGSVQTQLKQQRTDMRAFT